MAKKKKAAKKKPAKASNGRATKKVAPRQTSLVSDAFIKPLDQAASLYRTIRDERIRLSQAEAKNKQKLLDLMHQHKLKRYRTADSLLVVIESQPAEVIKVKAEKSKKKKKAAAK